MKLHGLSFDDTKGWLQQLFEWSRKKITFDDNLDGVFLRAYVGTSGTEIQHTLGRVPRYIIPVMSYPTGTGVISFTKEPTKDYVYLKRDTAGAECAFWLM